MSADEAVQLAVTNRGRIKLPPLDLLAPPAETANQNANARYQAQVIEETLGGFGVPAEVVEGECWANCDPIWHQTWHHQPY